VLQPDREGAIVQTRRLRLGEHDEQRIDLRFDGTFAQFYPTLRPFISKAALERAAQDHDIR